MQAPTSLLQEFSSTKDIDNKLYKTLFTEEYMAVKKGDFVALRYSGFANNKLFDSNIEGEIEKIHPNAKAKDFIIVVGKSMVVPGLDNALEGKELDKEYEVNVSAKDGFGPRNPKMVKTIPLKVFTEKQVMPQPGMVLNLDNSVAKIIAVSGARVITDFNNPLAGKDLMYKFKIVKEVTDENERIKALFEVMFRVIPEFEVKDKIIIKGPQILEAYVKAFSGQFKEMAGKELGFELKEMKKEKEEVKTKNKSSE